MNLKVIDTVFSICKVEDYSLIDLHTEYVFTGHTDEENSLVCPTRLVPENTTERDDGWRAFRIEGVLDFSLIGILTRIATCLSDNGIGIFAISTFNTDYILTKEVDFEKAIKALEQEDYTIVR
ncbi:MAG: ACT domain-containing protein [Prevotella sp.]|nr:ACT domain-containing protein [Prevotella sp.]